MSSSILVSSSSRPPCPCYHPPHPQGAWTRSSSPTAAFVNALLCPHGRTGRRPRAPRPGREVAAPSRPRSRTTHGPCFAAAGKKVSTRPHRTAPHAGEGRGRRGRRFYRRSGGREGRRLWTALAPRRPACAPVVRTSFWLSFPGRPRDPVLAGDLPATTQPLPRRSPAGTAVNGSSKISRCCLTT
jgi:hypothetical protein